MIKNCNDIKYKVKDLIYELLSISPIKLWEKKVKSYKLNKQL